MFGAILAGIFLLVIAMLSGGLDWYISEFQAELHYSAILDFHQVPLFSYFMNGGAYLFQDPQNTLISPTTIFILIFGPHAGLRWIIGVWGFVGFLGMYHWLKSHLTPAAAFFGSLVWVINLAIIWRIAVGNDMFMMHLGVPWFLLCIERIVQRPNWKSAVLLGLLGGAYLLGPSFHTLFYLVLPACSLWLLVLLVTKMEWSWRKAWQVPLCFGVAAVLSAVIAFPKLYAMRQFDFSRLLCAENSIVESEALYSLFDQTTAFRFYHMLPPFVTDRCYAGTYGIWESNVALFSVAYILVAIGIIGMAWFRRYASLHLFVSVLAGTGWILATWPKFWYFLTTYISESIRVSSRYLFLINLAFVILAALGWQLIDISIKHKFKYWLLTLLTMVYLTQAIVWVSTAHSQPSLLFGMMEKPLGGNPTWFDHQPRIDQLAINMERDRSIAYAISHGSVLTSGYYISGNIVDVGSSVVFENTDPKLMYTAISPTLSPDRLRLTPRYIEISQLQPHESAVVNLLSGQLGQTVVTEPEGPVEIEDHGYTMTVTNPRDEVINRLTITPNSPVPQWVWWAWLAALLTGVASFLVGLWYNHRRAKHS